MTAGWGFLMCVAALVAATTGCKRHGAASLPAGAIVFENSGVALAPGENWRAVREGDLIRPGWGELCLPALEGQGSLAGSLIEVCVVRGERAGVRARADAVRKEIASHPEVLQTSMGEEEFSGENGAKGVHLWYNQKIELPQRKWLAKTHIYLVNNKQGRCVGLCYFTPANRDAAEVHQMIRRTLTVQ